MGKNEILEVNEDEIDDSELNPKESKDELTESSSSE